MKEREGGRNIRSVELERAEHGEDASKHTFETSSKTDLSLVNILHMLSEFSKGGEG